ncbi:GreA/GreB family elongation factor [Microbacterium immunditiarum]|uniref:Transcription elongation factor GreA n=1 Tax=Microbacterium immunditiarum TaxID=337480 RepID=A0A7Y9GRY0_9MICO|nr:GreA/GreB family elongation factor [Microbacterium immunditiarum]NYE21402.1 transcription elongation factor GreA [Microbacterium immunditiarum]
MSNVTDPVWMTPATLASLEEELAELVSQPDADQARVIELRELIRRAEVGPKPDDGLVEPGMIVSVRFEADGSVEKFLLGSRDVVRNDAAVDLDVYSPTSPLGAAISGRYVGDAVTYATPSGTKLQVMILEAHPFG